jgi:DNA-binding winged helix-turn-helix (wHTH) protein/tetratricopeptide (TPR) repeat protein
MSASANQTGRQIYGFGQFRVDPDKQILVRDGQLVALTPKTFQLLLVLLRHSNATVAKDELLKSVWPDTFVEETNLTRNIFALRKALSETEQNRYIITVPGLGYRFASEVQLLSDHDPDVVAATRAKVHVQIKETRLWRWALAAAIVLAGAAGFFRHFRSPRAVLTGKDTLVLADFANSTGDAVFDGTLRLGLAVQLEQSPFLSLASDQRVQQTLNLMGKSPDTPLTQQIAREVCERVGATALVEGSITTLGSQYVLGLQANDCRTGDLVAQEQEQAASKERVLEALGSMAARFRSHLGESTRSVTKYSTPLAEATTPSLDALKAYSVGWKLHAIHGASASLPFFKRATEIDPQFAMAHASLGRIYADLDQSDLAAASLARAWQLRARTSEEERFFIAANYQTLVTGNLYEAQQTCEAWIQVYPREARPHTFLSGIVHKMPGRFETASIEAKKAIELEPDFWVGYYSLGVLSMYLGRWEESEDALGAGVARGLDSDEFTMLAYDLAALKGDRTRMEREAARARTRPGGENWMSAREALVAAYSGHLKEARVISQRATVQAQQAGQPERAALWTTGIAVREALVATGSRHVTARLLRSSFPMIAKWNTVPDLHWPSPAILFEHKLLRMTWRSGFPKTHPFALTTYPRFVQPLLSLAENQNRR